MRKGFVSILILGLVVSVLLLVYSFTDTLLPGKNSQPATNFGVSNIQNQAPSITTDLGIASSPNEQQGQILAKGKDPGMTSYQNDELGFKIDYPDGWNVGNYILTFGTKEKVATKGTAIVFFQGQVPTSPDKMALLGLYLRAPITVVLFDQPLKKFQDIISKGTKTIILGRQAIKIVNAKTSDKTALFASRQNIYVAKDQSSTCLVVFSPQYGGDDQLFQKVLDSLSFL